MWDLNLFFSYSHRDEPFRRELEAHLKLFERQGEITCWNDRKIIPGTDWKNEINKQIYEADIILALVSSDFLASDYCYDKELERALEQHSTSRSVLIPIILRPVIWSSSPMGKLQALPTDAKPVTIWNDRDSAWKNITDGILKIIKIIKTQKKLFYDNILGDSQDFIKEWIDLIYTHNPALERNIERLSKKHPEIADLIIEYRKNLRAHNGILYEDMKNLYNTYYSNLHELPKAMFLSTALSEIRELLFKCSVKEVTILETLEKAHLNSSLFGFSKSSTEAMKEMQKHLKLYTEAMKGLENVLKPLNESVHFVARILNNPKEDDNDFEDI